MGIDFYQFMDAANKFGLPWVCLIAVSIAYWREVNDRVKNSVDRTIWATTDNRISMVVANQAKTLSAISQLAAIVNIALFGKAANLPKLGDDEDDV